MADNRPIGIFDSGIGGLTVVKRIEQLLPGEDMVYFGDTARVPYGSKSNSTVIEYSIQNTIFLMRKNVKMIVVACNTASSVAVDTLRKYFNIPFISMIEPGSDIALRETKNNRIGVVGTNATINNRAYSKDLLKKNGDLFVAEKACPLFVPLAEEGWLDHEASEIIAKEYLSDLTEKEIDTLILGCTHYPVLTGVIQKVVGENVKLIDSGFASSRKVKEYLTNHDMLNEKALNGKHEFYVSDVPSKFKEIAERFLGREIENLQKIDVEHLVRH
ncbi:MAG: glutamate racemase [Ignavibacteria bacterium]|jgi:glutamate racemase